MQSDLVHVRVGWGVDQLDGDAGELEHMIYVTIPWFDPNVDSSSPSDGNPERLKALSKTRTCTQLRLEIRHVPRHAQNASHDARCVYSVLF